VREHRHPEELSLAELVDDVSIVEQLDRASADDEEMRRRIRGLPEDLGSVGERSDHDMFREIAEAVSIQVLEGRQLRKETGQLPRPATGGLMAASAFGAR
jgi:hypothetical protein